jgi:hypothetical protein
VCHGSSSGRKASAFIYREPLSELTGSRECGPPAPGCQLPGGLTRAVTAGAQLQVPAHLRVTGPMEEFAQIGGDLPGVDMKRSGAAVRQACAVLLAMRNTNSV